MNADIYGDKPRPGLNLPWGVPQPGYKSGGGHRTDRQLWAFLERFQTVTYLYGPG
jgi:hypothetical protein